MTTIGPKGLSIIMLLALGGVGLAQGQTVRTPSGRLELTATDASNADIEARRSKTEAAVDALRSAFKGRTFWFRRNRYKPLTCIDVLANKAAEQDDRKVVGGYTFDDYDTLNGVRVYSLATFVFETASGEHITTATDNEKEPFAGEVFFVRDPRRIFPARAWAYIERRKVFVGMTKDQALASWGRPERINKTLTRGGISEQWVYGLSTYLYFTNGRLTAAQN